MKLQEKVDEKIKKGTQGKLAGMVVAIKDNICYKGHKISASSKILEGFESIYSATVIEKLLKEDAIIIGRLNCDEFAMGSANENSIYGPVLNPHNKRKVAGGSSGGLQLQLLLVYVLLLLEVIQEVLFVSPHHFVESWD